MNVTLNVGTLLVKRPSEEIYVVTKIVKTAEFNKCGNIVSDTEYFLIGKNGRSFSVSYSVLESSMVILTMIGQKVMYKGRVYGEVITYNSHPCVVFGYDGDTPIVYDIIDRVCLKLSIVKTKGRAQGNWYGELAYTLLNVLNCNRYLANNGMRFILGKNSDKGIHIMCKEEQSSHVFKFSVGIMGISCNNWKVVIANEPQVVSALGNPTLSVYGYEDVLNIVYATVVRYSLTTVNLSFEVSKDDTRFRGWCVSRVKVNGF